MANLIQSGSNTTGVGTATTLNVTLTGTTAGNTLIAYPGTVAAGRTITVTDNVNAGNYNQDSFTNSIGPSSGIYSRFIIAGGSVTITAAISGAASSIDLIVEEWNGVLSPVDKSANGRNGGSQTTGSAGPTGVLTVANEIALAMVETGSAVTALSVAAPFGPSSAGPTTRLAAANFLPGSTAALTATFNWTTATSWSANLATYQVTTGVDTLLGQGWV